jgi:DNA-binding NarL/FixJ family response regulator
MQVVVIDDHSLFRDGLISLLEAAGFEVVGEAGDGCGALQLVSRTQPDVVLLDIAMPEMSGIEILCQIKAQWPQVKVVMLTVLDEDQELFAAIRAGADGYLLKSIQSQQLVKMLQGLERGEAAITRKTASRLLAGFADTQPFPQSQQLILTEREIELLELVAEGLSNRAIAERLSVSSNTVKYHMRNILQKLNAQNRTEAVMAAMRAGWLKPPSSSK